MAIESDRAEASERHPSRSDRPARPIALLIPNKDWENWQRTMHVEARDAGGRAGRAIARR